MPCRKTIPHYFNLLFTNISASRFGSFCFAIYVQFQLKPKAKEVGCGSGHISIFRLSSQLTPSPGKASTNNTAGRIRGNVCVCVHRKQFKTLSRGDLNGFKIFFSIDVQ